jgi:hypothetical protein|tara:strand:+ start:100 stop:1014 length:915 start_codon:yes stop_codon:yes gene_type:complete
MKVAFFSESGQNKKYPRNFPNSRTEVGWCLALDAPMCALNVLPDEHFDLGIVIVPKANPNVNLDFIRNRCDKVAVMQEGPHWYFQDYDIEKQFNFYNTLMDADWVYCHNTSDVKYYKGLGCKDVRVMRSLMIPEGLQRRSEWSGVTIIGGNFVNWYGGFDSYMVAREIGDPIVAPSMGRKQDNEDAIPDIQYLPYLFWREWIDNLSQYNIGVHLMRTHAAGTFAMNCGFHGIPCIGYKGLDTQEILHPLLSVDMGDLEQAISLGKRLKEDSDFYIECSETSLEMFEKFYTERAWKENWEKQWKK